MVIKCRELRLSTVIFADLHIFLCFLENIWYWEMNSLFSETYIIFVSKCYLKRVQRPYLYVNIPDKSGRRRHHIFIFDLWGSFLSYSNMRRKVITVLGRGCASFGKGFLYVWLCVRIVTVVWAWEEIQLEDSPYSSIFVLRPQLPFSLCNALSPPPFLPCFILHFLSLFLTPFLPILLACSIDRDYFCRRVTGFSTTLTSFFQSCVNTKLLRVCRSVDDSTLGFIVVTLCHNELATPLTADLCTNSRFWLH